MSETSTKRQFFWTHFMNIANAVIGGWVLLVVTGPCQRAERAAEKKAEQEAPIVAKMQQIAADGTSVSVDNPATVPRYARWVVFQPLKPPEPRHAGAGAISDEFVVVFGPEHWSEKDQAYAYPTLGFHTPPNARSIIKASIADDRFGDGWTYGRLTLVVEDPKSQRPDGLTLVTIADTWLRSVPTAKKPAGD